MDLVLEIAILKKKEYFFQIKNFLTSLIPKKKSTFDSFKLENKNDILTTYQIFFLSNIKAYIYIYIYFTNITKQVLFLLFFYTLYKLNINSNGNSKPGCT